MLLLLFYFRISCLIYSAFLWMSISFCTCCEEHICFLRIWPESLFWSFFFFHSGLADLKLMFLIPQLPGCWDYRSTPHSRRPRITFWTIPCHVLSWHLWQKPVDSMCGCWLLIPYSSSTARLTLSKPFWHCGIIKLHTASPPKLFLINLFS